MILTRSAHMKAGLVKDKPRAGPHGAFAAKPSQIPPGAGSPDTVAHHRTKEVDGIKIFYRQAGPEAGPAVLLLHGFPTSSHMFRNLIPALADRYRVIAPDYPGYGQRYLPDRPKFADTFDRFPELVTDLLHHLYSAPYT